MNEPKCFITGCADAIVLFVSVERGYERVFKFKGYACDRHQEELDATADKKMGAKFAVKTRTRILRNGAKL